MIKNLIMGALAFASTMTIGVSTAKKLGGYNSNSLMAASCDDIIYYEPDNNRNVLSYFEEEYGEENIYELKLISDNSYNVQNFDQGELNQTYNNEYGLDENSKKKPITGTCTLVACLGVVNYYSNTLGEFESDSNTDELYMKVVNACLNAGCTSRQDGTDDDKIDDCIDASFKRFKSSRRGDTNWYYLLDNIHDAVRWKSAIILDLPKHSTVVRGTVKYELTYNKEYTEGMWWWKETKHKKVTETFEFVHINEGWGYKNGSLIPANKIYNIHSKQQVTWAKK